jgi:trk system potassium uptake protein TrkA
MQVVIIGAGKTGRYLAEKLKGQHAVTMIEQRLDVAEKLRAAMPSITVVHGDADEPSVLEYAGVAHADLLAALTGDDEDNLVASFLAKTEFGVPVVFARVNHPANEWMFDKEWGVDVAVSTASIIVSLVEKEVSLGDIVSLMTLKAENVAIEEVCLPADSPVVGKTLAEVTLPEETRIMAIISDGSVKIPQGDTPLAAGDRLLLLATLDRQDAMHEALGVRGSA